MADSAKKIGLFLLVVFTALASGKSEPNDPIYARLKKMFYRRGDGIKHEVIRLGDKTVGVELFLSQTFDQPLLKEALSDFSRYGQWLPPGVNKRPGGGEYRVQLQDLIWTDPAKSLLKVVYEIHFPFITYKGKRAFKMEAHEKDDVIYVRAETIRPAAGPVGKVIGVARFYKVDNYRVWAYLKGTAKLKSSLLYEAMPERIIHSEIGDRIGLFVENYFKEENRLRTLAKSSKTSTTAKKK